MAKVITLMVITDGRAELLEKTLDSFFTNVEGPISDVVLVNDCVDLEYQAWIDTTYPRWKRVNHETKRGFCGAIQSGWNAIPPSSDYIFHLEDDFTFNRQVNLWDLIEVLAVHPNLHQLALRRQPWNEEEEKAGGIVEQWPSQYEDKSYRNHEWLEHRLFYTTNPSLYRNKLRFQKWPDGPGCERKFSEELFLDPEARVGFWGARDSGEWVHHIGNERVGIGY